VLIEVQRGQGAGEWPMRGRPVGRPDLYRRAIGNPPGAQEPSRFDRVDALGDCLGLSPVS
jgi:hypothetical protein